MMALSKVLFRNGGFLGLTFRDFTGACSFVISVNRDSQNQY